uniref:Amiloride-sensitive sodium channel n=1 Tax=Macrostomum lignano TaxID=282301 RepID=A0A1I8IQF7_9PLAT
MTIQVQPVQHRVAAVLGTDAVRMPIVNEEIAHAERVIRIKDVSAESSAQGVQLDPLQHGIQEPSMEQLQQQQQHDRTPKANQLRRSAIEFLGYTTAHGLGRFASQSSAIGKLIWIGFLLGTYSGFAYHLYTLFDRFAQAPVLTTMTMSSLGFQFPDVYICPAQPVTMSRASKEIESVYISFNARDHVKPEFKANFFRFNGTNDDLYALSKPARAILYVLKATEAAFIAKFQLPQDEDALLDCRTSLSGEEYAGNRSFAVTYDRARIDLQRTDRSLKPYTTTKPCIRWSEAARMLKARGAASLGDRLLMLNYSDSESRCRAPVRLPLSEFFPIGSRSLLQRVGCFAKNSSTVEENFNKTCLVRGRITTELCADCCDELDFTHIALRDGECHCGTWNNTQQGFCDKLSINSVARKCDCDVNVFCIRDTDSKPLRISNSSVLTALSNGPYCFFKDDFGRLEAAFCNVPLCRMNSGYDCISGTADEAARQRQQAVYTGYRNVAASGEPCLAWNQIVERNKQRKQKIDPVDTKVPTVTAAIRDGIGSHLLALQFSSDLSFTLAECSFGGQSCTKDDFLSVSHPQLGMCHHFMKQRFTQNMSSSQLADSQLSIKYFTDSTDSNGGTIPELDKLNRIVHRSVSNDERKIAFKAVIVPEGSYPWPSKGVDVATAQIEFFSNYTFCFDTNDTETDTETVKATGIMLQRAVIQRAKMLQYQFEAAKKALSPCEETDYDMRLISYAWPDLSGAKSMEILKKLAHNFGLGTEYSRLRGISSIYSTYWRSLVMLESNLTESNLHDRINFENELKFLRDRLAQLTVKGLTSYGALGLWSGISVLTICELLEFFYYISIGLALSLRHRRDSLRRDSLHHQINRLLAITNCYQIVDLFVLLKTLAAAAAAPILTCGAAIKQLSSQAAVSSRTRTVGLLQFHGLTTATARSMPMATVGHNQVQHQLTAVRISTLVGDASESAQVCQQGEGENAEQNAALGDARAAQSRVRWQRSVGWRL